jgi:hypothetical protein
MIKYSISSGWRLCIDKSKEFKLKYHVFRGCPGIALWIGKFYLAILKP